MHKMSNSSSTGQHGGGDEALGWWMPGTSGDVKIAVFVILIVVLVLLILAISFVVRKLRRKEGVMVLMRKNVAVPEATYQSQKRGSALPQSEWEIAESQMAYRVAAGVTPTKKHPNDMASSTLERSSASLAELGLMNHDVQDSSSMTHVRYQDSHRREDAGFSTRGNVLNVNKGAETQVSDAASSDSGDLIETPTRESKLETMERPLIRRHSPSQQSSQINRSLWVGDLPRVLEDRGPSLELEHHTPEPIEAASKACPSDQSISCSAESPSLLIPCNTWMEAAAHISMQRAEARLHASASAETPLYGAGSGSQDVERRLRAAYLEALGLTDSAEIVQPRRPLGAFLTLRPSAPHRPALSPNLFQDDSGGSFSASQNTSLESGTSNNVRDESDKTGPQTILASTASPLSQQPSSQSSSALPGHNPPSASPNSQYTEAGNYLAGQSHGPTYLAPTAAYMVSSQLAPPSRSTDFSGRPSPHTATPQRAAAVVAGPLSLLGMSSSRRNQVPQQHSLYGGQPYEVFKRTSQSGPVPAASMSSLYAGSGGVKPFGRGLGIGGGGSRHSRSSSRDDGSRGLAAPVSAPVRVSSYHEIEEKMTHNPLWNEATNS
ncbi:hypothetical protein CEUSTIGMA_g5363.t1 [Chlamydomonas eustigma]|uniref:Uncharacterized protein n=1 Tax=Chlamydomonas eustigma TaxID=1157962 RepID=A0A250X4D1_9CHLO|nr:hypothetical protein CEUSTIGMA_g5363.t1 [Chlamydomonas eustigma]|eukprot:GAX77921.1 hypothetical protein CEUSTIGMA_g5363.t1 [Chlamydomonas eustigma]